METLIGMRDVLRDMRWHKRIAKKISIVGDLTDVARALQESPEVRKYPEDGKRALKRLQELEGAVEEDDYLEARKKLDAAIKAIAGLVADGEIESWRKGK